MSYGKKATEELFRLITSKRGDFFEKAVNSNRGELIVLQSLSFSNGTKTPKELAGESGVSNARVANVLNALEKKGEIERSVDVNDRRKIQVTLTEKGKRRISILEKEKKSKMEAVFHEMGEEETEVFLHSLQHFMNSFEKINQKEKGEKSENI